MPTEPYPTGTVLFSKHSSDLNDSLLESFATKPVLRNGKVFVSKADCIRLGLDPKNPRGSMLQALTDGK